jgi:hypothetical protein
LVSDEPWNYRLHGSNLDNLGQPAPLSASAAIAKRENGRAAAEPAARTTLKADAFVSATKLFSSGLKLMKPSPLPAGCGAR